MPGVFGDIITNTAVEDAVTAHLRSWMPTYLAEVAEAGGLARNALPNIRTWVSVSDFDLFAEDQIPAGVVVCPGLAESPRIAGDGRAAAGWDVGLAFVVSGQDRAGTRRLAGQYAAAARTCVLQQPGMGGFAAGTEWVDERYDLIPAEDARTLAAGYVRLVVHVEGVSSRNGGTAEPLADPTTPHPAWATVDTVNVDVRKNA